MRDLENPMVVGDCYRHPTVVMRCDYCGAEIEEGDRYYLILGVERACKRCVSRRTAGE